MSRILLTWELGLNLGHVARLLPIAQRLQADGHIVLVAARDIHAASRVLAPARSRVLSAFSVTPASALRELFADQVTLLATLPELDHYGARSGARYIGPLLGRLGAPRVDWPQGQGPRIFACLRPDTRHAQLILTALSGIDARVICVAAGFTVAQMQAFGKSRIRFASRPVDLEPLRDAQLCITYGAEGTMLRFLSAAVPQLISRWHVETYMAARRIEATGSGAAFPDVATEPEIRELILSLCGDASLRAGAARVAQHLATFDAEQAATTAMHDGSPHGVFATDPVAESIALSPAPVSSASALERAHVQ